MKKPKEKVELRYYEVPPRDYLFTLQGEPWRRVYEYRGGLLHFHNLMEIGVCREGEGILLLEDEHVPYHPGMISVIPENYPHGTASKEGTESYWEYLFLDLKKAVQDMYPDDVLFQQKLLDRINRKAFFREEKEMQGIADMTYAILEETRQKKDVLYMECIVGLAMVLIVQLARFDQDDSYALSSGPRRKSGIARVRPALEYILEHFAEPMKIADVAAVCHMSESHFRRVFEENVGLTPVEYLNHVRIWKACDLLRRTGSSMEEVAMKAGFATTSTFNRNFKRITGTSPYQWKKQPEQFESRLINAQIMVEKGW